jgi:PhoPQ-activated pathogenicity-related protein
MKLSVLCLLFVLSVAFSNPLDDYVNKPDPAYKYELLGVKRVGKVNVHTLNMTSQTWLTDGDVSQTLWFHYVLLYVPDSVNTTNALLYITGGRNSGVPSPDTSLALVTTAVSAIVVDLHEIPNQPLVFKSDPLQKSRTEDAIIAFAWKQYMSNFNPLWLPRLPMVKASVRAMDATQDYVSTKLSMTVDKFVVMGASKRGWTTWLVGAVDTKRVKAIAPIVIDVLKCTEVFMNIYKNLACHWPEAFQDYIDEGITARFDSPEFKQLASIVDPFVYNERLQNTPKFIVNAGDDDFFQPDGSTFSFPYLLGPKHIRYVPNTGHSLAGSDALFTLASFFYGISRDVTLPNVEWKLNNFTTAGAYLTVFVDKKAPKLPTKVTLWQATNPKVRDFRIGVVGKAYTSTQLNNGTEIQDSYTVLVKNPPTGYIAFMIELQYDNYYTTALPPLKFTTSAFITPNTYPQCQ